MIYFISGHGNLTFEEWMEHYKPEIDQALSENASFLIGDFRGCDIISAEYLKSKTTKVSVCHLFTKPRYKVDTVDLPSKEWKYLNFTDINTDEGRDNQMTIRSDADIAWIRKGKENSGTAKNIQRRATINNQLTNSQLTNNQK